MKFFTGQFERIIDGKNRIQLPSQLRGAIDPSRDGEGVYVIPGRHPGTLAVYTERGFEELAARMETEFMSEPDSRRFELQFYSLASYVDMDKQGRLVLPERLRRMAQLREEVYLIGQKSHMELWNRDQFDQALGIDFEGREWPDWHRYLHMRPSRQERDQAGM